MTDSLFTPPGPLADRMRPRTLDEFAGQPHLLAPGQPLGDAIRRGDVGSIVLWGPPGTGKTTLARLVARHTDRQFVSFSAVSEGIPRVREIIKEAEERRRLGRGTILFVDEIHRLNRGQQDAFLPAVEQGIVTLIGATTENPSFELNAALLSRARVWVLELLPEDAIATLLDRAVTDSRGLGGGVLLDPDGRALLARVADGDARRALTILESAANHVGPGGTVTPAVVEAAMARRLTPHDKSGEQHYDLISALHKAIRGSDPQAALYWLARMLAGGEDPLFLARRLVRMASEDIGLADPNALRLALAGRDAFHFLGSPEGELALAEVAVYLATAPKSNRVYLAWGAAQEAAANTPVAAVPFHIRNAPTKLMKSLGYGAGYRYAFDDPAGYLPQVYLPEELEGTVFYQPGEFGYERRIGERMDWWRQRGAHAEAQRRGGADDPNAGS
ncbi:MAG: replication-associated recombination protein A [Gemmatimonadales bacterium]|nr:replication-associated recombination protein A [Gemmatimonadales bacterium]MDZ4388809.1 replication-associated recombination protein A [Gemmatimonadales bacterium]